MKQSQLPKPDLRPSIEAVTLIVPELAVEIGFNESVMLMQIRHWIRIGNNYRDGQWWTYQSIRDMRRKAFPYWSVATISRTTQSLSDKNLVIIRNEYNEKGYDKTQWFALNVPELMKLHSVTLVTIEGKEYPVSEWNTLFQNETGLLQDETDLFQNETTIPETPTEITTKTPKTSNAKLGVASEGKTPPALSTPWAQLPTETSGENADSGATKSDNLSPLSKLIAFAYPEKPSYLTDTQELTIRNKVQVVENGDVKEYPSPSELYERDELFQKFVKAAIALQKGYAKKGKNPNIRASKSKIIAHIRGYERKDGWLSYERKNRSLHRSEDSFDLPEGTDF